MESVNLNDIVLYLIVGAVTLAVLIIGYVLLRDFLRKKTTSQQQEGQDENPRVIQDFNRANAHLGKLLDGVEDDSGEAGRKMEDIKYATRQLVSLATGLCRETERLAEEIARIDTAIAAVMEQDINKIRRAGAELCDLDLQALLQADVHGSDFWDATAETLSSQAGLMTKQSRTYRRLATGLLADVRINKAHLIALQQQRKFTDYARPLLQSRIDIQQAEQLLMLPATGEIRRYTIGTPTAYAELSGGEV